MPLLALVTFCGLFQPSPQATPPQVTNITVVQDATAQTQTGNPSVTPGLSSVKVQFNTPMNRPSVERSINIFPGRYDPTANPVSAQKLQLTSLCHGVWQVHNPNPQPISFSWNVFNKTENGLGVVNGNQDVFFQISKGNHIVQLLVNGVQQAVKATNTSPCSSDLNSFVWSDSSSVTVTPKTALEMGQTYTLVVSTGAKNDSGSLELAQPYSSVFTVGASSSGVLTPGGSYTGLDGITIGVSQDAMDHPVNVSMGRIKPKDLPIPLPDDLIPIMDFYRIVVSETIYERHRDFFDIAIPIPAGEDPIGVIESLLYPIQYGPVDIPENMNKSDLFWGTKPANETAGLVRLQLHISILPKEGIIVGLSRQKEYRLSISMQEHSRPFPFFNKMPAQSYMR